MFFIKPWLDSSMAFSALTNLLLPNLLATTGAKATPRAPVISEPPLAKPFKTSGAVPTIAAVSANTPSLSINLAEAASAPFNFLNRSWSSTSSNNKSDKVSTSSVATAASTAPVANNLTPVPAFDSALATPKAGIPN